jgi:hypothetical protein
MNKERFYQLLWRPRPKSLLDDDDMQVGPALVDCHTRPHTHVYV